MARLRRSYRPISPNLNFARPLIPSLTMRPFMGLVFFYSRPHLQITTFPLIFAILHS